MSQHRTGRHGFFGPARSYFERPRTGSLVALGSAERKFGHRRRCRGQGPSPRRQLRLFEQPYAPTRGLLQKQRRTMVAIFADVIMWRIDEQMLVHMDDSLAALQIACVCIADWSEMMAGLPRALKGNSVIATTVGVEEQVWREE